MNKKKNTFNKICILFIIIGILSIYNNFQSFTSFAITEQQIDCDVKNDCDSNEFCVFSMFSDSNSHIALCDKDYSLKLCCKTKEESDTVIISDVCEQGSYIASLYQDYNSHIDTSQLNFDNNICFSSESHISCHTEDKGINTNLYGLCDEGNCVFTIYKKSNSHVAGCKSLNKAPMSYCCELIITCGDGVCQPSVGENCETCPEDCPISLGEICCLGIIYTGNCCNNDDCNIDEQCINHVCTASIPFTVTRNFEFSNPVDFPNVVYTNDIVKVNYNLIPKSDNLWSVDDYIPDDWTVQDVEIFSNRLRFFNIENPTNSYNFISPSTPGIYNFNDGYYQIYGDDTWYKLNDEQVNVVDCDDNNPCTDDSYVSGQCQNTANNSYCQDGLWCNGLEICDVDLGCLAGTPPSVDDGVTCTVDSCDENNDQILHTPQNNLCNNNQFCDGVEYCDATLDCQVGIAVNCNDNIGCTSDSCNEATNDCDNTPIDIDADDYSICSGPNFDCDDSNELINPGADDSNCDGIDQDCDNVEDDGYIPTQTICGLGECVGNTGQLICVGGFEQNTCNPLEGAVPESCEDETGYDGIDNNCDNIIDLNCDAYCDQDGDNYAVHGICLFGCLFNGWHCFSLDCDDSDASINPGMNDICDGIDNDCDNSVDGSDEPWFNVPCDGLDLDLCEEGVYTCSDSSQVCTDLTDDNIEICDGIDNDCNKQIDEALSRDCSQNYLGNCAIGIETCSAGNWQGCPFPEDEDLIGVCDNIDNNCNGLIDETKNTDADNNCNSCVENDEFTSYANKWIKVEVSNKDFTNVVNKWITLDGCIL